MRCYKCAELMMRSYYAGEFARCWQCGRVAYSKAPLRIVIRQYHKHNGLIAQMRQAERIAPRKRRVIQVHP